LFPNGLKPAAGRVQLEILFLSENRSRCHPAHPWLSTICKAWMDGWGHSIWNYQSG